MFIMASWTGMSTAHQGDTSGSTASLSRYLRLNIPPLLITKMTSGQLTQVSEWCINVPIHCLIFPCSSSNTCPPRAQNMSSCLTCSRRWWSTTCPSASPWRRPSNTRFSGKTVKSDPPITRFTLLHLPRRHLLTVSVCFTGAISPGLW